MPVLAAPESKDNIVVNMVRSETWHSPCLGDIIAIPIAALVNPGQPHRVKVDGDTVVLEAGQSIKIEKGVRIQYANPFSEPCEYLAICTPAFSIDTVNREDL